MRLLTAAVLLLTAVTGSLVVFSRHPTRQVFALGANGAMLSILFFVLEAPDVAFSELAVGTAITPLLYVAALAMLRARQNPS